MDAAPPFPVASEEIHVGGRVLSWLGCIAAQLLGGCSVAPTGVDEGLMGTDAYPARPPDVSKIPDAVPRPEPLSKYGNPPSYQVDGKTYYVMPSSTGYRERGIASWYGTKFHGRRTSSGEPYDMYAMTAAHKTLPLPAYVRVTNLRNQRSVVLRVNDRGPFVADRVIDLSYTAATKLGILGPGTGIVEVVALNPEAPDTPSPSTTRLTAAGALDGSPGQTAAPPPPDRAPAFPSHDPALFLQVGAFLDASNAEHLRDRLMGTAHAPTRITEASSAARRIYRVRIGPLDSVEQADSLAARLRTMGITEARIVVD
jgi:rare lipoprotein A